MYRLKPQAEKFIMMSGPFEGRTFAPGKTYSDIPKDMADQFEKIPASKPKVSEPDVKKAPEKDVEAAPASQKTSTKERK